MTINFDKTKHNDDGKFLEKKLFLTNAIQTRTMEVAPPYLPNA